MHNDILKTINKKKSFLHLVVHGVKISYPLTSQT